ncbi:MAG: sulfurtransferase TusA family protein [Myxococcota bacterium]
MTGVGARLELDEVGLDRGGHLLLKRALADLAPGVRLEVRGRAPALVTHLRTWCRQQGHRLEEGECLVVVRGGADRDRWHGARRAGGADRQEVVESPAATWGLAARSALVESGGPRFHFPLDEKVGVWADVAGDLYRQALRAQWDPDEVIPWAAPLSHPDEVEDALVQVLTYLIENETAALLVPARFAAQTHPHFREVMQLLAIQAADEARHVEVFTRRALLRRRSSGAAARAGRRRCRRWWRSGRARVSCSACSAKGPSSTSSPSCAASRPMPARRRSCASRRRTRRVTWPSAWRICCIAPSVIRGCSVVSRAPSSVGIPRSSRRQG